MRTRPSLRSEAVCRPLRPAAIDPATVHPLAAGLEISAVLVALPRFVMPPTTSTRPSGRTVEECIVRATFIGDAESKVPFVLNSLSCSCNAVDANTAGDLKHATVRQQRRGRAGPRLRHHAAGLHRPPGTLGTCACVANSREAATASSVPTAKPIERRIHRPPLGDKPPGEPASRVAASNRNGNYPKVPLPPATKDALAPVNARMRGGRRSLL